MLCCNRRHRHSQHPALAECKRAKVLFVENHDIPMLDIAVSFSCGQQF